MARIVQDSDDELEDDLEADMPPAKRPDASGQRLTHDGPLLGTGPTDELKGPSAKPPPTHAQLLPSQDEPQSSVSLPDHPNKRRKTDSHLSPTKSPLNFSSNKRSPVTYGKSGRPNLGSPSPSNASPYKFPGEFVIGDDLTHLPEAIWNLEGTIRDDYARHEPAMFAEPSSTVPNATMTQQRVLDVVNAPVMLGQESETVGPYYVPPPEGSVPWSDLIKFTPAEATEQIQSSSRGPPPDLPFSTPPAATLKGSGLSASQESIHASSLRQRSSPLRNNCSPVELNNGEREPVLPGPSSQPTAEIPTAARLESRGREQVGSKKSSQRNSQSSPSSDDELMVVGLPEERYKPRPSRSRSLKIDIEEPIDYSVRPERAKKISKRRRATAEMDPANMITTPEKVRQICDMGFTPSTTAGALKRNCGDVIQTIDWLVTNNVGHDELAPQSPPKVKSKLRKSDEPPQVDVETVQDIMRNLNQYRADDSEAPQSAPPATSDITNATMQNGCVDTTGTVSKPQTSPETALNTSPVKVQVVIPKKLPKAATTQVEDIVNVSSNKAKRRKTTLDQPEGDELSTAVSVPEVVNEKKKGRGRPKKTISTVEAVKPAKIAEPSAEDDKPDEALQTIEPSPATAKAETNLKAEQDKAESLEPVTSEATSDANLPPKPSPTVGSDTPERSAKPAAASPINKNKVPYRVGLSKRARIAPLLRTLKK